VLALLLLAPLEPTELEEQPSDQKGELAMNETATAVTNPMPGRLFATVCMIPGFILGGIFAIPIAALWIRFVARAK
jgi:hypothetical protein